MSELYEKSQIKLELQQVLNMLSSCACSLDGREACLKLQPTSDLEDVQVLIRETTAASDLSTKKGYPGFNDITDVSAALDRAVRGGCLHPGELLNIAGVLRCARNARNYISEDEPETVLTPLFRMLISNKFLEDQIFGAILSEEEIGLLEK